MSSPEITIHKIYRYGKKQKSWNCKVTDNIANFNFTNLNIGFYNKMITPISSDYFSINNLNILIFITRSIKLKVIVLPCF
jgi:hypothetical protein